MCTNLTIQNKLRDKPMISARTMDFVPELKTKIYFYPREQSFPETAQPGEMKWINEYGFITMTHTYPGVPGHGFSDGLNEEGLSAAALWLEITKYPEPEHDKHMLYNINLVSYILGSFKRVDEIINVLKDITVADFSRVSKEARLPLHYIISDITGKHLIIEFINGEMKTYMNETGVLTNEPAYDWQQQNLFNYENLKLINNPKPCWGDELYGSGQIGMPGDPTAVSRFVRAEFLSQNEFHPKNIQESIGAAFQIIQNLAVPCGTVYLSGEKDKYDWTQWCVIRDHTHRSIYFYSAFNSRLYGIHMKELDMDDFKKRYINVIQPNWYVDVTRKMQVEY